MLRKYQLLKNLIPSSKAFYPPLSFSQNSSFPFLKQNFQIYNIPFSYSSFSTSKTNVYKGDLHLLNNFSPEQKAKTSKIMDKYAAHREDLTQLTSDDIQWMFSGLYHLSLVHVHAKNHQKAYDCLFETDYIFRKLGTKDTIDVALNYYDMSSILIAQKRFAEAKDYLNEVDRICKLLGEDPQTKSLTVQRWHLLAQIESHSSKDRALGLYNSVLENADDINQKTLPAILLSTHKEMGEIYSSRGDIDNMIKSWEKGFQAGKRYFGENSTIAFNFLLDIIGNLALHKQQTRAEPYAENCLKLALRIFPNPHEKVAMVYSMLGNTYSSGKKYTQAENSYNEAFKIYEKLPGDYSDLLFDTYFNMATTQAALGNHQQASDFLTKASQTLSKTFSKPDLSIAHIYYRWANDLRLFEMSNESKEYYWKALDLYKNLDPSNRNQIFEIYSGLGQIVFAERNYEKSLEIWKEAEKYLDPTDHNNFQLVWFVLEGSYDTLGNHEESLKYQQKILQSCSTTGNTSFIVTIYYENGKMLEEKGNLEDALECFEFAAKVYEVDAKKDPAKVQDIRARISQVKEKLQITK